VTDSGRAASTRREHSSTSTWPVGSVSGEASAQVETVSFASGVGLGPDHSGQFRDYFALEFCSGYWELGEQTSNEKMNWGRVKAIYGR